ncbi:DsrE family protein [Roseibium sediminis]|uniref:DsrE family protein n=1 Tax=Roseibium sediminis TaxID=1775174 RepID=UPI00123D132F|nr:DsrE family protein [Roseibium sediminis]
MRFLKIGLAACMLCLAPMVAYADGAVHKIAFHVDENDPQVMNMALNNVQNVSKYYADKGEEVEIEVVTYGPGLMMLREDKSPVAERISVMSLEIPNLSFAACGNTHRAMSQQAGKEVPLLSEAKVVPSGVVRLVELQEAGYSYIRP